MTLSRRKLFLFLGLIGAVLLYWFWPGRSWNYANLPPTATGPWVAFGDSLTEGYGSTSVGGNYPAQLSARLGVPIQNLGVSGDTTADALKRLDEVDALSPRVVLFCFGGNDVLQGLPRDRMFANLGVMIDRFLARGSFVVLIGVRGATVLGDANAEGFKELAEQKKVKHVPNILDGILTHPDLMTDYVHPNDAGYAKIAERLEKELRPLLGKIGPK